MGQYNATVAVMHNPWPKGQLYHAAGPADGGVLIAAVWETKDRFDRFLRDRVMPSDRPDLLLHPRRSHRQADPW